MNTENFLISTIFVCILFPALCQAASQVGHEPLLTDTSLSFDEVFQHALQYVPERLELDARQQQANAYRDAGNSFIAGGPSIQFSYFDDALWSDFGYREQSIGIQMPLWRWGERDNAQQMGQSYLEQQQAWENLFRLEIAGRLRAVLTDIHEAETKLELEKVLLDNAEQLVEKTQALHDAGEVPRLDVIQAQTLFLQQQKRELETEALLVDAERSYAMLTGLDVRPANPHIESLSMHEDIDDQHLLLLYLMTEVDIAEANIVKSENDARTSPLLSFGTRREKPDQYLPYIESMGVTISVPFGGGAHVNASTSSARMEKVDTEILYLNTFRKLQQMLHEVEHELFLTRESLLLADQRQKLGEQSWEMAQQAFELGEITMAQVVVSLQEFNRASLDLTELQLQEQRLIIEFNQTIGELP